MHDFIQVLHHSNYIILNNYCNCNSYICSLLALNRSYVGFMDKNQMLTIFINSQPLFKGMHLIYIHLSLTGSSFHAILYIFMTPDGTPKSHIHETIHVALFAAYTVLSVVGAVFAIACLIFNLIFRNKM